MKAESVNQVKPSQDGTTWDKDEK